MLDELFKDKKPDFGRLTSFGFSKTPDGYNYSTTIAEDAVFEFMYHFPGFTNKIEGRSNYMAWFAGYDKILHSADGLKVYKAQDGQTTILEYEVHGVTPETGKTYDNRFCSIITVQNRKIVYWRDYMDSLAAMLSST